MRGRIGLDRGSGSGGGSGSRGGTGSGGGSGSGGGTGSGGRSGSGGHDPAGSHGWLSAGAGSFGRSLSGLRCSPSRTTESETRARGVAARRDPVLAISSGT